MKYEAGSTAVFEASFFSSGTTPAVLDQAPEVEFYTVGDAPALVGATITVEQASAATWTATVELPEDMDLGWYKVVWMGTIGPNTFAGVENFEVVSEYAFISSPEELLRRRLNDRIEEGMDEEDAFFMDDEVHTFLALAGGDIFRAALDGWAIKMAWFSDSVDIAESGSERKGSQLFRQAQMMAKFYSDTIKDRDKALAASTQLPTAVVVNLRNERTDIFGFRYNPFSLSTTEPYVRLFPLKRFMDAYYLAMTEGWAS